MSDLDPLWSRLDDAVDFLIETGNGSAKDDLPKWAEGEGVQLLIDARERIQAVPTVVPMRPDEKPTEPGWYVTDGRKVTELRFDGDGGLTAFEAGTSWEIPALRLTFIARIYPERIGEE